MSTTMTRTAGRTRRGSRYSGDDGGPGRSGRRRWVGPLAWWLIAAVLAGTVAVVWFSPVLGLRTVDVSGPRTDAVADQVRDAVGIAPGTPLIRVDLDEVERRVEAVGAVASATVDRQWPHTLAVTVRQRVPLAVTQANGTWWLLDATGKPYTSVTSPPQDLMPIKLATPGEGDRATLAALGVLRSLPPDIRESVAGMSAPTAYDVSLRLADGRTVIWGSDSEDARKAEVLPAVLDQPGETFDISDPTLVTVR